MLDCASAVVNQRQCERRFAPEVLATFAADYNPATRLGCRRVMLQQHRFADSPETGEPDIARERWECRQIRVEPLQLGCPIGEVRRIQSHARPEGISRPEMILFWRGHLRSFPRPSRNAVISDSRHARTSATVDLSSAETARSRFRRART